MSSAHTPDAWSSVAEAYERHAPAFVAGEKVSAWLVDAVEARPGVTVLDLATGPGYTSLLAAARGASVICTDLSPSMLEVARRRAAEQSLDGIEFRLMDAQDMDLADGSVDGVLCRYGVMLMPDLSAVLAEVHRALRPGRPFAYAVWGSPEHNMWASLIRTAAERNGHRPEGDPLGPGGMMSLADPARNMNAARAAGFSQVTVETLKLPVRFDSFEEYWTLRREASVSTQNLLAALTDDEVAALRRTAERIAADHTRPDGELVFDSLTLAVRAIC